jgi:hypothetical protein
MKNKEINKERILKSVSKMIADKNAVRFYIKGETSLDTLTQKGIRFAKPL